eukprot:403341042
MSAQAFLQFFNTPLTVIPNQNTKVILLNAPTQAVSIKRGAHINSWYDIIYSGGSLKYNEHEITQSAQRIQGVIKEEAQLLGNDSTKIFIGGISQGCCIAIESALSYKDRIGGVVALSGHALPSIIEQFEQNRINKSTFDKLKQISIFAYHGKQDYIIQEVWARKTYDRLKKIGFTKLQYFSEDSLGHTVSPTEIGKIRKFLGTVMKS